MSILRRPRPALGLGAAAAVVVLVLSPVGARASFTTQRAPASALRRVSADRAKSTVLPRLWAVQVGTGPRGWFDRAVLKSVRKEGINALTLRISDLGRKPAGAKAFESVRRFAVAEGLYLIAVLPAGKPATPAARRAAAACADRRFVRLRCAVQARSLAAAARLARKYNAVRQLIAVYVGGPGRLSGFEPAKSRRRIIAIVTLFGRFDSKVWGAAITQTAASGLLDMGIAPRTRRSSGAVRQFAALLAGAGSASGTPTPPPPPPPPPPPSPLTTWTTANLWVSASGGPSCVRAASPVAYSAGASNDCSSMQAAQTAASGGDRVVIVAGSYGSQVISSGAKSPAVDYYAQSYLQPATAADVLSATTDVTVASLEIDVDDVDVYGVQAASQGFVDGGETMSQLITLVAQCNGCLVDGWRGHAAREYGTNITFSHVELGNANYCSSTVEERDALQIIASPADGDSVVDSVLHDWYDGSSKPDGACGQGSNGAHDDCIQSNGGNDQVIADDLFYKCGSSSVLQWGEFSGGLMGSITIENDYFGSKPTEYNILSMGQGHCSGLVIRNNVFEDGSFDNNSGCSGTPTQDNNIMLGSVGSCEDGGSFVGTDNIFAGSGGTTCGTNAKRCTPSFKYGRPSGYSYWQPALAANDTCAARYAVSDHPATDFYGVARPSAAAAGASEPGSG